MSLCPTHPLYSACAAAWLEYRLCYQGGRPYTDCYIARHPKEPVAYYRERLCRATHPNHVRAVIDTYAAHLYRAPIPRTSTSDTLDALWADMDLLGTPANELYERVAQLVQRDGRCAVVVDRLDPVADVVTRSQEREVGRRPYAYAVEAVDLLDWSVDRMGRLVWVVIRERQVDERAPLEVEKEPTSELVRIWYRDRWQLVELDSVTDEKSGKASTLRRVLAEGDHPCGEVPVALVYWGARHGVEPIGDSALTDLAPANRRLTNLVSLIDEQIYQHVFSILAVPESTFAALEKMNFSPSGVLSYRDDVSSTPYYLAPDVSQIQAIRSEIDKTEAQIRALSGLGRVNEDTKHVQSGLALSYVTMDKDALLAKFGQRMSRVEGHVDRLAAAWMEERNVVSQREYPMSFDPQDVDAELANALKFAALEIPGMAGREAQIAVTRSYLGSRIDPERLQEVLTDLLAQPLNSGGI